MALFVLLLVLQDTQSEIKELIEKLASGDAKEVERACRDLLLYGKEAAGQFREVVEKEKDTPRAKKATYLLEVLDVRAKLTEKVVDEFPRYDEKIVVFGKQGWGELLREMARRAEVKELTAADFKPVVVELAKFDGLSKDDKDALLAAALTYRVRESTSGLVRYLKDPEVRETAAYTLVQLNSQDGAEIAKLLADEDKDTRLVTLKVLANLRYRDGAPAVRKLLADKEAAVRAQAAATLAQFKHKEAAPDLVPLLRDDSRQVREAAAYALAEFDALDQVPNIVPLLDKKEDRDVRRVVLKLLAHMKADKAVPNILALLSDDDKDLRLQTVAALGRMKAKEALPELLKRLSDSDLGDHAARAIARIGTEPVLSDLYAMVRAEDGSIRDRAVWVLRQERSADLLKQLSKHKDAALILTLVGAEEKAVQSLGEEHLWLRLELGDKSAVKEAVEKASDDALLSLNALTAKELYSQLCRRPPQAWKQRTTVARFFEALGKGFDGRIVVSDRVETAQLQIELQGVKTIREAIVEVCRLAGVALLFEEDTVRVVPKKEAVEFWASKKF